MALDFDKYNDCGVPYPNTYQKKQELREVVDNTPMTTADRDKALKQIAKQVDEWYRNHPYHEARQALTEQFWKDCREDIGYTQFLTQRGCEALEANAWDRCHDSGFYAVYWELAELAELAKVLTQNAIVTLGAPAR